MTKTTEELLMESSICSTCGVPLHIEVPSMTIHMRDKIGYFCINCIKRSFGTLAKEKQTDPAVIDLMREFRKFLNRYGKIARA